jgi:hypothetical protein
MSNHFSYCFFKYVHSVRLGESLNVGLLIVFPNEKVVLFKYPDDLQRLKCTYYDFQEEQLKAYLKSFDRKAKALSYVFTSFIKDEFTDDDFLDLIKKEFIPEDEGALQFSQVRKAVKYTDDIEQIADELYYSYFEHFYDQEELVFRKTAMANSRRDELYIMTTLQELIIKENPILQSIEITGRELKTNSVSLKFDFEWNNHGLHLVKPLSLDYRNAGTIEEKAHSLHSKLHIIDKEVELEEYQFDVMVSKPQLTKFDSVYKKAISILKESSQKTNVIEEDRYSEYSKKVATALST